MKECFQMTASRAARPRGVISRLRKLAPGVEFVTGHCADYSFPQHVHEGYTIGQVIAGREIIVTRGRGEPVGPGVVYFNQPDEAHSGQSVERGAWRYHSLYLTREALSEMACLPLSRAFTFREAVIGQARLSAALAQMFGDLANGAGAGVGTTLREIIALVCAANSDAIMPRSYKAHDAVERARNLIRDAFRESLPLEEIASEARLNPTYLINAFRERHGLTPHAYLIACRVLEARRQLAAGASIAEAALASGFYDQSHLTRHFRRHTGMTPGSYARAMGAEAGLQTVAAAAGG